MTTFESVSSEVAILTECEKEEDKVGTPGKQVNYLVRTCTHCQGFTLFSNKVRVWRR